MPFFRKKPVVIEARQMPEAAAWFALLGELQDISRGQMPPGLSRVVDSARGIAAWCGGQFTCDALGPSILIDTLKGQMRADPGDWIIRGVKGEFYPCKPDIFDATYEAAE
ncbi:hypothetical protein [Tabrizicola sp.]|uniref:hypothetical protein n=1 Tax=Tabrizicola sp. TaxID=2005166 RepID=UPI002FDEEB3E